MGHFHVKCDSLEFSSASDKREFASSGRRPESRVRFRRSHHDQQFHKKQIDSVEDVRKATVEAGHVEAAHTSKGKRTRIRSGIRNRPFEKTRLNRRSFR